MCRILLQMATRNGSLSRKILTNLELGVYSLMGAPRILVADRYGVFVHKDGPHQDDIKSLENMDWDENHLNAPKLKASSYGDYDLTIGMISTVHFDTRELLDKLYVEDFTKDPPISKVERISFEEALGLLTVSISCDMDYYLSNREEMDKDLDRKVDNFDPNNKHMMKELEAELFYKQSLKIFGEDEDNDDVPAEEAADQTICQKVLTLKEFHLLYSDGNNKIATARRGSSYILLFYGTS